MAKRRNPKGSQLVRGFILGQLYERGHKLTTARIRGLGASRATAKRDMTALALLVKVTPSKPLAGLKHHLPKMAMNDSRKSEAA